MNQEIKTNEITLNSFLKHKFKVAITNSEVNNNIITEYSLIKPSIVKNWVYLIVWHTENKQITISTHILEGFKEAIENSLITKRNINKYIKQIYQGNIETELELENILNKYIPETKEITKEFNYNDKLMSLTKQKIINISKDLYVTIKLMQKEIDLYKEKYNQEKNNYYFKTKENSNLIKDIDSIKDYSERICKQYNLLKESNNKLYGKLGQTEIKLNESLNKEMSLIKQNTKTIKSNTNLIKEIIFLTKRNLFQRILNIQYKKK